MEIIYPYSENLPTYRAHDVYVFQNCCSLTSQGAIVTLLCGYSSWKKEQLCEHYRVENLNELIISRLPILRKPPYLNFSWNKVFFYFVRRVILKKKPEWVISSIFKQGKDLISHRVQGVSYAHEIHQLSWYPNLPLHKYRTQVEEERAVFNQFDLLTVTTSQLKTILENPPYKIKKPIELVPLAIKQNPLCPVSSSEKTLRIGYVGQLYQQQGVDFLLHAVQQAPEIILEIFGGCAEDILRLKQLAKNLDIDKRVILHGFISPQEIPNRVKHIEAFVAPFKKTERMPYVAHTKVLEYFVWGRWAIVPDLEVVKEHVLSPERVLFYGPDDLTSLVKALHLLTKKKSKILEMNSIKENHFSWEKRSKHLINLLQSRKRDS